MADVRQNALSGAAGMDQAAENALISKDMSTLQLIQLAMLRTDFANAVLPSVPSSEWQNKMSFDPGKWVKEARQIRLDYEAAMGRAGFPGFRLPLTPGSAQVIGSNSPFQALVNAALAIYRLDYPPANVPVDPLKKVQDAVAAAAMAAQAEARDAAPMAPADQIAETRAMLARKAYESAQAMVKSLGK